MVKYDNPLFEQLSNALFSGEEETRLKMIKYNHNGITLPSMYLEDPSHDERCEESLKLLEEDIKKARAALALFQLMRQQGVKVIEEG